MIINPSKVNRLSNGEISSVEFETAQGILIVTRRFMNHNMTTTDHEFYARPRMFVGSDRNCQSVIEDLANRTRRPMDVYRKGAMDIINKLNLPFNRFTMSASQNAGCRTCPCSPGFILKMAGYEKKNLRGINFTFELPTGEIVNFSRFDLRIILTDAPDIDVWRPSRQLVGSL